MRKRNIKTVAHWVIMSILLLFPILMVGISSFANDEQTVTVTETYEYETNDVNSVADLVLGNIYKIEFGEDEFLDDYLSSGDTITFTFIKGSLNLKSVDETLLADYVNRLDYSVTKIQFNHADINLILGNEDYIMVNLSGVVFDDTTFYAILESYNYNGMTDFFGLSDYLGHVTTDVDIQNATYKQEINNWCNGFKNLPVNQWYGQLLNVIGVGQTTNSVMNVIYVYPLYVLWVYLIDLIVDCLLVIIHFGHNALSRLGGDND